MTPKPKPKPRAATARQDFIHAVTNHDVDYSRYMEAGPSQLSADQLRRAYGLSSLVQEDIPEVVKVTSQCDCKWTRDALEQRSAQSDLIVIDSDEDDVEFERAVRKDKKAAPDTSGTSSKGKGNATDISLIECSPSNCSNNPKCLNHLGQDKWESSKAFKDFSAVSDSGAKPTAKRHSDTPCGLRNLGATCYANSFLQVWFRDVPFRAGVYACLPPKTGNVESSPLFQLQVLFAFLQKSNQALYDPEPLVRSLKLDTSEQQDATEFSKLFMTLLDDQFKKHGRRTAEEGGDPTVARLVQDQFEGKITYGTRCGTCGTASERSETYHELEVTLKPGCRLLDRINANFEEENLVDDNQYFCDVCQKKRDAVRFTRLESVPPVLHFSIIRFVFNYDDLSRSKSQSSISYPLQLDMGEYLPQDPAGRKEHLWYDLKGVLMHKGKSAHHGHYVAQVHDESLGKWFLFDDECVTPIDDLNGPDLYNDEGERVQVKKPRAKAGVSRDKNGDILPKSKDAYMLVYTRRAPSGQARANEPEPPPLAFSRVQELDAQHDDQLKIYHERRVALRDDFQRARDEKRSVYRTWDVQAEDGDSAHLVDKAELRRWLENGIVKPLRKGKEKGRQESSVEPASNGLTTAQPAVESRDELSFSTASPTYRVNSNNTLPVDVGTTEVLSQGQVEASAPQQPLSASFSHEVKVAETNGHAANVGLMPVDQKSDQAVMSAAPSPLSAVISLDNSKVVCLHGRADPERAEQMKRISSAAAARLKELGVNVVSELKVPDSLCRECVWSIAAEAHYAKDHTERVTAVRDADDADDEQMLISRSWYMDWCKTTPKMHDKVTGLDPAPDASPFEHDVVCEHGKLQPNAKRHITLSVTAACLLCSLFPGWSPTPDGLKKRCKDCESEQNQAAENMQELAEKAKKERTIAKSLEDQMGQSRLHAGFVLSDKDNFVIPLAFARAWVHWCKNPAKYPRPGPLDNSVLHCRHSRIVVDLENESDRHETVSVVTTKQWRLLVEEYTAKPPIKIWQDAQSSRYLTLPAICQECLDERRKDFAEAKLAIRVIRAEDLNETGVPDPPQDPLVSETPKTQANGVRKSRRIQSKPGFKSMQKLRYVKMLKGDTVVNLRIRIAEATNIATICQRLFFNSEELTENDRTVESIGLFNGAMIDLLELEEADMDKLDDTIDDHVGRKGKRTHDEGFGGTGLFGWDLEAADAGEGLDDDLLSSLTDAELIANGIDPKSKRRKIDHSSVAIKPSINGDDVIEENDQKAATVDAEAKIAEINCPTCTSLNDPVSQECDVCGMDMGL